MSNSTEYEFIIKAIEQALFKKCCVTIKTDKPGRSDHKRTMTCSVYHPMAISTTCLSQTLDERHFEYKRDVSLEMELAMEAKQQFVKQAARELYPTNEGFQEMFQKEKEKQCREIEDLSFNLGYCENRLSESKVRIECLHTQLELQNPLTRAYKNPFIKACIQLLLLPSIIIAIYFFLNQYTCT